MKKSILVLLIATPLLAQNVTIKQVNDRRSSGQFFNHLTLFLELPKVKATDVAAWRVLVASAVDSSGNSLVDETSEEPQLEANTRMGMGGDQPMPASVDVVLKNPDRKATSVKEVRGDIELFMPSKDPNSVAEIAKFLSFSGKPLTHKSLKANGVEIALVSQAQIDAKRRELADAKRKELAGYGYEGESLEESVKSHMEYTLKLDEGDVLLRVKDPNKRIQDIVYVAGGETKRVSTSDAEGFVKLSTWGDKPQPDWGLRVSMTTPKNLVRQSFVLTNVPLP